MFTSAFWKDAGERAVKTFAQALLSLFIAGVTILNIDWTEALAVGATAAVVSILTSIVSVKLGAEGTASLVEDVHYEPVHDIGVE